MGDVQRGCHSQKVLELVPGAFLHLHERKNISHSSKKQIGRGQTLSLVAVFGSITLRMSRVSWVREVPTWPCLITKDFGVLSEDDAEGCVPFR